MILSTQTQNILRLLSEVILADGHIFESEVEALILCVEDIGLSTETGTALTEPDIRGWFAAYLEALNKTDSKEREDVALTRLILSLADWPAKRAVVSALENISKADAEFHREEKLLISVVKTYWQHDGLDAQGATIGA